MTNPSPTPLSQNSLDDNRYWWQHLTPYHWFVILVASMAWFFDCLDQRIFSLARVPALAALKHLPGTDKTVQDFGKVVTAFFLIGWGIGGMFFGALGDKFGRARMLTVSILIYSVFTGLSFFSRTSWDFTIARFLTGVGVGGVFGLAVALIAETVPTVARTQSLGLLQILSAIGNITASGVKFGTDSLEKSQLVPKGESWRYMFLVGAVPAVMVILTMWFLREPEPWLRLKEKGLLPKGSILAPYFKLFTYKRWRRNLIVGALIASTGVIGLWAIGEYAVDLQRNIFTTYYDGATAPLSVEMPVKPPKGESSEAATKTYEAAMKTYTDVKGVRDGEIKKQVNDAISLAFLLNQIGAALGMWIFTRVALKFGRRLAFLIGFSAALVSTFLVYWKMSSPIDAYWMMPIMGMAQLSVFAGFSIYLPELFPSSLRSTGTSFCYNLGRFAAAGGSFFSAVLSQRVFSGSKSPLPLRYSAMTMCVIFLIGLATLPFAPETKGQPLPEDQPEGGTPDAAGPRCAACGASHSPMAQHCPRCGKPLASAALA